MESAEFLKRRSSWLHGRSVRGSKRREVLSMKGGELLYVLKNFSAFSGAVG